MVAKSSYAYKRQSTMSWNVKSQILYVNEISHFLFADTNHVRKVQI